MLYFAVNIYVKAASLIAITQIIIAYSSNFIGGYIGDHFDEKSSFPWPDCACLAPIYARRTQVYPRYPNDHCYHVLHKYFCQQSL